MNKEDCEIVREAVDELSEIQKRLDYLRMALALSSCAKHETLGEAIACIDNAIYKLEDLYLED